MSIQKEIPELVSAKVISQKTADNIVAYYRSQGSSSTNRLFIVFGVLGAILVGLGIILIIAHNWDELTKNTKTIIAFSPLLMGQIVSAYALLKKQQSAAWCESAAAFLFFAVGASISLVSQIYNITGNTSTFILTWMVLCLPIIYLLNGSITSLLYLCGITYYATIFHDSSSPNSQPYFYWVLLLLCLPHYYYLYKNKPKSNYMVFHNWLVPISLIITLGTFVGKYDVFIMVAYFSLFGLFYLIGNWTFFINQKPINNAYKIIGWLGSIVLLIALSFDGFWEHVRNQEFDFSEVRTSPEFIASLIVSLLALALLFNRHQLVSKSDFKPVTFVFVLFILVFILGLNSAIAVVLVNIIVFVLGILTIGEGAQKDHLGLLNYGLLIITALIVCRFFDQEISFVIRGILFVTVGFGFFVTNYWMLNKRKSKDE